MTLTQMVEKLTPKTGKAALRDLATAAAAVTPITRCPPGQTSADTAKAAAKAPVKAAPAKAPGKAKGKGGKPTPITPAGGGNNAGPHTPPPTVPTGNPVVDAANAMIPDLPACLAKTPEERAAHWKQHPPRKMPKFQEPTKAEDPATTALRKEVEAAKAGKKEAALRELRERKEAEKRARAPSSKDLPKPTQIDPSQPGATAPAQETDMSRKTTKTASPKTTATSKARTAVAPKAKTSSAAGGERKRYDWDGARERANKGTLPTPPDFSANTHRYYRPILAEVVKLAKAGDLKGLKAFHVKGSCTSPAAIKKYREVALIAMQAKKG
jgi:hypothetical protein